MSGDSSSFSTLRTSAYVPGQAYNVNETGQTGSAPRQSQSDGHDGTEENSDKQTQPVHQQAVLADTELLANRVAELEKKLTNTEKDNRTLRSIIFKLSAPPQPHEDDGFYLMKLNSLDVSIERFVAQSFKDATDNYLDPEYAYYIRQVLGLYRPGRALLRFLDQRVHTSISAIYSLSFPRMVLVRHIIALCLWAHVFNPICFGVSDEVNKSMAKLFDYVSAAEKDYMKVLSFRQAIGEGLCEQAVERMRQDSLVGGSSKRLVINRIEKTIAPLLPIQKNIKPGIQRIVETAVELSHRLTSEKAIFTCEMIASGEEERENYTSVPEDGQAGGVVYACVFPLFGKRVMVGPEGNETLQTVPLRAASVIYEREIEQSVEY